MLLVAPPAPVALAVSPASIVLKAPASKKITLRNTGSEDVVVEVTRRAIGESAAFKSWLRVVPASQSIRAGRNATFTLRVSRTSAATPGDHSAVVLLTTRRISAARIAVRLRVGVRVLVRVPGRLVRRVDLGRLLVKRNQIVAWVVNRGNVVVRFDASARLLRRGRIVTRLRPRRRGTILPGGRAAIRFGRPRRLHGPFVAELRLGREVRRYRVRL
jgi:P pilus assembly chaperone PapD